MAVEWRDVASLLLLLPLRLLLAVLAAAVRLLLPARPADLRRDTVLVTGGGRGIGRYLAAEFARQGARKFLNAGQKARPLWEREASSSPRLEVSAPCLEVEWSEEQPYNCMHLSIPGPVQFTVQIIIWGRTEKCLKETCEEIRSLGVECHYFVCDVGNKEEVYQQAKAVREKVGDVTILVNNAAVVHGKSLVDSDDDALLKSQHINTLGQFWTTKAFLPRMLELQHGHIVCMNSVLALSAIPGAIDYCTSKSSSFAFMESLTLGLLDCPGVNATTVLPFHTSTEMFHGMKTRFPKLFPPLKPDAVARRTVEAVRTNQALLLLPWTMHLLVIMKSVLPQTALEEIYRFTGSYVCMDSFKGRT